MKDHIQAWQYGPVVSTLYQVTKPFGRQPIDMYLGRRQEDAEPHVDENDARAQAILDAVWREYGRLASTELVALTHRQDAPEGRPWHVTWHERGGARVLGAAIPRDLMAEHFVDVVESSPTGEAFAG